jgi:hypothetical protein
LIIDSGRDVTIKCPDLLTINLYSNSGEVLVDMNANLRFVSCNVLTVAARSDAATGPVLLTTPGLTAGYFATSRGKVHFTDSRFLLPSEVCCFPSDVFLHRLPAFS